MTATKATIEAMLGMTLDTLYKMSDTEIDSYLAECIKICPPPTRVGKPGAGEGGTTRISMSKSNRMSPQSSIANQILSAGDTDAKLKAAEAFMEELKKMNS